MGYASRNNKIRKSWLRVRKSLQSCRQPIQFIANKADSWTSSNGSKSAFSLLKENKKKDRQSNLAPGLFEGLDI